jgi:hypothetical protein
MDELQGRAADLLTRQAQPLCARCVGDLIGMPHLTARGALESLVAADAVSYADQCRRCGGSDTVVEARAARFEGDLQTPH